MVPGSGTSPQSRVIGMAMAMAMASKKDLAVSESGQTNDLQSIRRTNDPINQSAAGT